VPYTPASRLSKGKRDPGFRTKPQQAAALVGAARQAGICFRAVVADCFYGDNEGFTEALGHAGVAFVLAVKPGKGVWAPAEEVHTPQEAARQLAWGGPTQPGDWTPVVRRFRDGHAETWWAAHARLPAAGWGPDRRLRLVVATTDPATLPKLTTWYLVTNLAGLSVGEHARPSRRPTWPRWCACTACATGSSRVTSRSNTSWAGPTSRSEATARSAATGSWCAVRSRFAGGPGLPTSPCQRCSRMPSPPRRARGGRRPASNAHAPGGVVAWPVTLRRVRSWLIPWVVLERWWRAWSPAPPPAQLRLLLDTVGAGRPLHLYLPP
jgi:hypothetical protein